VGYSGTSCGGRPTSLEGACKAMENAWAERRRAGYTGRKSRVI